MKTINFRKPKPKCKARVNANIGAAQAVNVNKNEELKDEQSNSYEIGIKAELKDPEVTGSDTLDIKLEFPFGGKLEIKATSNVTSSVLAQQTLNEQARKNMEQLGQFLASAAMAIAPSVKTVMETLREQRKENYKLNDERRREYHQIDKELDDEREKAIYDREIECIKRNHEKRMLELQLDAEYEKAVNSGE